MVIYHAGYASYLPNFIAHRLVVNKGRCAYLLVSSKHRWSVEKKVPNVKGLEKSGVFEKVVFCDSFSGLMSCEKFKDSASVEKVEQAVVETFDGVFNKLGVDITNMSVVEDVITFSDMDGEFKIYLSIKKRVHRVLEMYPDSFNTINLHHYKMMRDAKGAVYGDAIQKHSALDAKGDIAIPVLHSESKNSPSIYSFKKYETLNFTTLPNEIEDTDGKKIVAAFLFPNDTAKTLANGKSSIVLMQNSVHTTMAINKSRYNVKDFFLDNPDSEYGVYPFQLAVDYFLSDTETLFIKPHPQSFIDERKVKTLFGRKARSLGNMPTNYFRFVEGHTDWNLKHLLNIGSSSINTFGVKCQSVVNLGYDFFQAFYYLHTLTAALNLCIRTLKSKRLFTYGCPPNQIKNILQYALKSEVETETLPKIDENFLKDAEGATILFVDVTQTLLESEIFSELFNGNFILIFLDVSHRHTFLKYCENRYELLTPIIITKIVLDSERELLDPLINDAFYVFAKKQKDLRVIRSYKYERTLPIVGVKVSALPTPRGRIMEILSGLVSSEAVK